MTTAGEHVVEEHLTVLRHREDFAVTGRGNAGEHVERERSDRLGHPHEIRHHRAERFAQDRQQRLEPDRDTNQTAVGAVGSPARDHTAENPDRRHPIGKRVRRSQRVGGTTGQADDRKALHPQTVDRDLQVVGEVEKPVVPMRRRQPDPWPIDTDDADTSLEREPSSIVGDLLACPRGSVKPQHRLFGVRRAELGDSERAAIAHLDTALISRRGNRHRPIVTDDTPKFDPGSRQPIPQSRCQRLGTLFASMMPADWSSARIGRVARWRIA